MWCGVEWRLWGQKDLTVLAVTCGWLTSQMSFQCALSSKKTIVHWGGQCSGLRNKFLGDLSEQILIFLWLYEVSSDDVFTSHCRFRSHEQMCSKCEQYSKADHVPCQSKWCYFQMSSPKSASLLVWPSLYNMWSFRWDEMYQNVMLPCHNFNV